MAQMFLFGFLKSMIQNIVFYSNNITSPKSSISFRQNIPQTLTHTNIGSCLEGYIGKVRVRQGDKNVFLNVFKKYKCNNLENYTIQNDKGDIVGTIDISVRKIPPSPWEEGDFSHVFVDELRNFSNPSTPYHSKGLEYYKDIGTRLLQIAQRRSDESRCSGNIKLISKGESLDWYLRVIGMRQEFPPIPGRRNFHNPNLLYLPPENKEPLSRLQGGL